MKFAPNFLALWIKLPNGGRLSRPRHLYVPHQAGDAAPSGVNVVDHEIAAIQNNQREVRLIGNDKLKSPSWHIKTVAAPRTR
jgi:hypothetical protein